MLHPNISHSNLSQLMRNITLRNASQSKHLNRTTWPFLINCRLCITDVPQALDQLHHALSSNSFTEANYTSEQKQTCISISKWILLFEIAGISVKYVIILYYLHTRSPNCGIFCILSTEICTLNNDIVFSDTTVHQLRNFTTIHWKSPRTTISCVFFLHKIATIECAVMHTYSVTLMCLVPLSSQETEVV